MLLALANPTAESLGRRLARRLRPQAGLAAPPESPDVADADASTTSPPESDAAFPATTSSRLSAVVRLVACFSATQIVLLGSVTGRGNPLAMGVLFLFIVYAGTCYVRSIRTSDYREGLWLYRVDAVWTLALVALTGGSHSHFSFFLSVPVLFASLRWGFGPGMSLAIGSALALFTIGVVHGSGVVPGDVLLAPVGLLVLGYLVATWAHAGLVMNRRLASLKAINSMFSPRLNIEQIIDGSVRHLAHLYRIDRYVLFVSEPGSEPRVHRANLPDAAYRVADTITHEIAAALDKLDIDRAAVFRSRHGLRRAEFFGVSTASPAHAAKQAAHAMAAALRLDCAGFVVARFALHRGRTAYLFIGSNARAFGPGDLPFFRQLHDQLSPRIENVQLLDQLASEVAERERQKISRDIHDSAIQPYIGLKFALEALNRKASPDHPLSNDIARLVSMATNEIVEMRRFVKGLRSQGQSGDAALVPALRRQATRFGELYGIDVDVRVSGELRIGDALADEVFHIVSEGLSNVRRHTEATRACIDLSRDHASFTLSVTNPADPAMPARQFVPRSMAERAAGLGGTCLVENRPGHDTLVIVQIPLESEKACHVVA